MAGSGGRTPPRGGPGAYQSATTPVAVVPGRRARAVRQHEVEIARAADPERARPRHVALSGRHGGRAAAGRGGETVCETLEMVRLVLLLLRAGP